MGYGAGTFGSTTRIFAVVLALAVTAAGGCELVLGDLPPVQGTGGAGGATASSTTASSSASSSSSSRASSTTASATSSTSSSSSAGTGGACCDCDKDHVEAEGMCGGKDCDDHDPLVYPGELIYYGTPAKNPVIDFDYDCSGMADPNPALNTTVNCGLIPCPTTYGYLQQVPPPCGMGAPWGTCKQQGLGCVNDVTETSKVMTCK